MKNSDIKHLSLRINADLLKKFHYVCDYDGRSANAQLAIYIRNAVQKFELKHGQIDLESEDK